MKTLVIIPVVVLLLVSGCRSDNDNPMTARIVGLYEPGTITAPAEGDIFEIGALMEIRWTGFNVKMVRLELLKKSQYFRQVIAVDHENQGSCNWVIPPGTVGSVSYQVKLINAEEPADYIYSGVFEIK